MERSRQNRSIHFENEREHYTHDIKPKGRPPNIKGMKNEKTPLLPAGLLFGALSLALATPVQAAEASEEPESEMRIEGAAEQVPNRYRKWHVMAEAFTDAPFFGGGRLEFEVPGRLRLGTAVGFIPSPYVDLAETVVTEVAGAQDPAVNEVFRAALEDSLVARGFLSWSPWRKRDFYISAGYSLIRFGGDLTSTDLLQDAIDFQSGDPINGVVRMDTTLHGIYGEMGYRFYAGPVTFRLSLGFTGTVASNSNIDVTSDIGEEDARELAQEGEEFLNANLSQYAMVPTLGLGIGYDFGF